MSVTYYVALPFLKTEDGIAAGQAQEVPSASAAIRRAELMSRDPLNAGALTFGALAIQILAISESPRS
jgi:hypothetical protein